jgi:hypothetical protein
MADSQKTPATDAVKALAEFLYEPDLDELSADEIRARLKESKTDVELVRKRFATALAQAKGRIYLTNARERRESFMSRVAELRQQLTSDVNIRERVRDFVQEVFGGEAEAAVAWRNFERATDADLRTMIDDLTLLEDLEKDDFSSPQA